VSRLLSLSLELRMVEAAMKKKTRINDNRTPEKARKTATTMTKTHAPIAKKGAGGSKPVPTTKPAGTSRPSSET
jgi:hypothetical protein